MEKRLKSSGFVLIYARVSTVEQVNKESLHFQIEECKKYAETKGLQIKDEYVDKGMSGTKSDRKEFQRMLREAKEGDTIISYSISRLSRSTKDFLDFITQCEDRHISVKALSEEIDTSTAHGVFLLTLMSSLATLEANQTKKRNFDMRVRKLKKGETYCVKYGYDNISTKPPLSIPNFDEQIVINNMLLMRHSTEEHPNGMSLRKIAADLNDKGIKPKRKGLFTAEGLRQILVREQELRLKKHRLEILPEEMIKEYIELKMPLIIPYIEKDKYLILDSEGQKIYDGKYEDDDIVINEISYLTSGGKKRKKFNCSMRSLERNRAIYEMSKELEAPIREISDKEEYERMKIEHSEEHIFRNIIHDFRHIIFDENTYADVSRLKLQMRIHELEQKKLNPRYKKDEDTEYLKFELKLIEAERHK